MSPPNLTTAIAHEPTSKAALASARLATTNRFRPALATVKSVLFVVIVLLVLEVILGLAHVGEQEYLKVDPLLGLTHLENKLVTDRSEAFAVSRISSAGLCDVEHTVAKPQGVVRIAVLGDSMTEALQVPTAARFTRILEQQLNQSSGNGAKFEVINFGNGAFSTGQEYLQFVQTVAAYHPDLTILMFHQGDEEKNAPAYSKWSLRPTFRLNRGQVEVRWQEFDRWRTSESALPLTLFDWARRHSRIWGVLLQAHNDIKNDPIFSRIAGRITALGGAVETLVARSFPAVQANADKETLRVNTLRTQLAQQTKMNDDTTALPSSPAACASDRWPLTLSLLNLLSAKCFEKKSKFIVVSMPARETTKAFQSDFRVIEYLGKRANFKTIDLTYDFANATNQKIDPLYLAGHLSERGHELVGRALAKNISSTSPPR